MAAGPLAILVYLVISTPRSNTLIRMLVTPRRPFYPKAYAYIDSLAAANSSNAIREAPMRPNSRLRPWCNSVHQCAAFMMTTGCATHGSATTTVRSRKPPGIHPALPVNSSPINATPTAHTFSQVTLLAVSRLLRRIFRAW